MTTEIQQKIKQEIIDLHDVFVTWFTGVSDQKDLEDKLASRFLQKTIFITTQGDSVSYNQLMTMFKNGYGKMNSNFKIAINNVVVLNEIGEYFLVNYTEWQTTDPNPELTGNYTIRKATVLLSKQTPFKWLHIHETMMAKPNEIIADWKS